MPSAATIATSACSDGEVVERRRGAVGAGPALEEPRLHLGWARELDLAVGPVAEPPPHVAVERLGLHHVEGRAAPVRRRGPSPGRPTPPGGGGPWPTCGSRPRRPATRRRRPWRSPRTAAAGAPAPGRNRSTRMPVPPPERLAQSTHLVETQGVEHGDDVAGGGDEPARLVGGGRVAGAVPPQVDADRGGTRPGGRWASGSNTPAQKPLGCRSRSGGPSPPQSSAPMRRPSCSTDHCRGSSGAPVIRRTLPDRATAPTGRVRTVFGYPAEHADRSRNPLAL